MNYLCPSIPLQIFSYCRCQHRLFSMRSLLINELAMAIASTVSELLNFDIMRGKSIVCHVMVNFLSEVVYVPSIPLSMRMEPYLSVVALKIFTCPSMPNKFIVYCFVICFRQRIKHSQEPMGNYLHLTFSLLLFLSQLEYTMQISSH